MEVKRLNFDCINCLIDKYLKNLPADLEEEKKITFAQQVLAVLSNARYSVSAPELVEKISVIQKDVLGAQTDFSEIKSHYNKLMLGIAPQIEEQIVASQDPIKTALSYAMAGNYIDFGAMNSVDETELMQTINAAADKKVDEAELENLKNELLSAKKLAYLTDNCGEIVLDKLFIKTIREYNPEIEVTVIVRGEAVLNDCTLEDAVEVGMYSVAEVIPNGTAVAGTCLEKISDEARTVVDEADLIISKGQGNFETLRFSNKNIYYIFLCKCKMFAQRFNVERLSGMLINDLRI